MRTDILEQKEQILQWIQEERPKSYICKQLHCKPETLNSYLEKMDIIYAGQKNKIGQFKGKYKYETAQEYVESGANIRSQTLKSLLFRDGTKKQSCEICGLSEWQGVLLPLELHHKNCNHYDNELSNLMILCPNCHSIQEDHSGANVGKFYIVDKKDNFIKKNFCVDCGKEISEKAKRCKSCAGKEKNKEQINLRPSREELKALIRNTPFLQIGKKYNVSDNTIRKWCLNYNLPHRVADIKNISDEEWDNI